MQIYLPHVGDIIWWKNAIKAGTIYFNENEKYNKQSLRNRLNLINNNLPLTLTIPVEKHPQNSLYKDIKISYAENYIPYFLKTLKTVYGNYPYFYLLQAELCEIYSKKHPFLWDLNYQLIKWINGILQSPVVFEKINDIYAAENSLKINESDKRNESVFKLIFSKGPYAILDLQEF